MEEAWLGGDVVGVGSWSTTDTRRGLPPPRATGTRRWGKGGDFRVERPTPESVLSFLGVFAEG